MPSIESYNLKLRKILIDFPCGTGVFLCRRIANIHQVTVTTTGWEGLERLAEASGCKSISELLERLGREGVKAIAQTDVA
jgi:hypothetical protein